MQFHDGKFLIYDSVTKHRADDLSIANLEAMGGIFMVTVDCYGKTDMLIPAFEMYETGSSLNIDKFYQLAEKLKNNPTQLCSLSPYITPEIAKTLVEIGCNIKKRTSSIPLVDDISDYVYGNPVAVAAFESQRAKGGLILPVENKTLFQKTETDKLFIQIPADSNITSYVDENNAPMPVMSHICQPYPSMLYRTWDIDRILSCPLDRRLDEIKRVVNSLNELEYEGVPTAQKLMSSFTVIPEEYVFGNSDNNDIDIQPNEKDYHTALISFIKHHINLFNKTILSGATAEELEKKNEDDFAKGNLPKRLEEYLSELLYVITAYHYSHTGRFTLSKSTFNDDDDSGNDNKDEEVQIAYVSDKPEKQGSDADICIKGYIQLSAETYGASVWADALVKLCRWGSLKPTRLLVGENNPNTIDLERFEVRTSVFDVTKFEKIVDEDGCSLQLRGYMNIPFQVSGIGYEMPAVFIVETQYDVNKDTGQTGSVLNTISVQDTVDEYLRGNKMMSGLSFVDGEFQVDDAEIDVLPDIQTYSAITTEPYETDSLVRMSIENKISNVKGMSYALLNQGALVDHIPSTDDLVSYLASQPSATRSLALYGCWLKAFSETAQDYEMNTLSEFMNWYLENVYSKFADIMKGISPESNSVSKLQTSNLFSGMRETVKGEEDSYGFEDDTEEDEPVYKIFNGDIKAISFIRINNIKENEGGKTPKLIGGYYRDEKTKRYVFASVKDGVNFDPLTPATTFFKMAFLLFSAAVTSLKGSDDFTTLSEVVSENTIKEIYRAQTGA